MNIKVYDNRGQLLAQGNNILVLATLLDRFDLEPDLDYDHDKSGVVDAIYIAR